MAKKDSIREEVIVSRRFGDDEDITPIYVGAVIFRDGEEVVEQFRVPVNVSVKIPIEVIAQLKGRGVPKEVGGKLKIAPEFLIEKA